MTDYYVTLTGELAPKAILNLVRNGCTGFRLIYKGIQLSSMMKKLEELRNILSEGDVRIMVDLPGLKPRLGSIDRPRKLQLGDRFTLTRSERPSSSFALQFLNITEQQISSIHPGHRILFNDGALQAVIDRVDNKQVHGRCVGGKATLTTGRSLTFPDSAIRHSSLSSADKEFLLNCAPKSVIDEIAISFVDSADIINTVRDFLQRAKPRIIAKIEAPISKPSLAEIARAADKLLLGRGDLSMSLPYWQLFDYQSKLITFCTVTRTPLIVATGILATLSHSSRPSIAECCDVCYLVSKGVSSFLIADDVSVLNPMRALKALRSIVRREPSANAYKLIPL